MRVKIEKAKRGVGEPVIGRSGALAATPGLSRFEGTSGVTVQIERLIAPGAALLRDHNDAGVGAAPSPRILGLNHPTLRAGGGAPTSPPRMVSR